MRNTFVKVINELKFVSGLPEIPEKVSEIGSCCVHYGSSASGLNTGVVLFLLRSYGQGYFRTHEIFGGQQTIMNSSSFVTSFNFV